MNSSFRCSLDSELISRLTYKKKVVHLKSELASFRVQKISKAALNEVDWNSIMNDEDKLVFEQSYSQLAIHKLIPIEIAVNLIPFVQFYKRALKLLTGRYFKNILSKYNYHRRFKCQRRD